MKHWFSIFASTLWLAAMAAAQTPTAASLHGTVTDPSGALVPGAVVQLRGASGEQHQITGVTGQYNFSSVFPGKYFFRVTAKGFTVAQKQDLAIDGPFTLDVQLVIATEAQQVDVTETNKAVNTDPADNGNALVLGQKELETLSDDPDELSQQLQAMAGPGGGPNGGQIYIDGFTGNNLPPKSSIREVRINSNPFSPEYDKPGFGRIEILTKPGSDVIHGQFFGQYNKEALDSRSPLLAQSTRPPYKQYFEGASLTGPIKKNKASFGLDFQRRDTGENAFVLATTIDSSGNQENINEAVHTPQKFMNISPRLDYALTTNNTLVLRYQNTNSDFYNQGVGGFNLPTRAYNTKNSEHTVQATETSILNPHTVNETRFQFLQANSWNSGGSDQPSLVVVGAFSGGGSQIGNSGVTSNRWEVTNMTTYTHGAHTFKFGVRVRDERDNSTAMTNFGGSYTFIGGYGPEINAQFQPIPGTVEQLTALEVFQRTAVYTAAGLSNSLIRELGGGAYQFSVGAGTPTSRVTQGDLGAFLNDDWRIRPNFTLSLGARYEAQTNINDHGDISPRVGIAWGIDGKGSKAAKTVLRAGFGIFYDRIPASAILSQMRYNGVTQQAYVITDPSCFPSVPTTPDGLAACGETGAVPQTLQFVDAHILAPRTYQSNLGFDRQVNAAFRLSANWINTRGAHLSRAVNINTPIDGSYPFVNPDLRVLTESTGFSRANNFILSPNLNYKKLFLFGFYAYSFGKDDNEGYPADSYNLRAEWGPSTYSSVRHRIVIGTSLPLPWKFSLSPFLVVSSGVPFDITTGLDTNETGFPEERPSLLLNMTPASCTGGALVYKAGYGCFDLLPAAGTQIGRNFGTGPWVETLMARFSRSWVLGGKGESAGVSGPMMMGPPPGGGGGGGGGGRGMMLMGAPPPGMMGQGASTTHHYVLTLGINAVNVLNHANYAVPSGNLSSPYFGVYQSLAGIGPIGASTYNRKVDVQLRMGF